MVSKELQEAIEALKAMESIISREADGEDRKRLVEIAERISDLRQTLNQLECHDKLRNWPDECKYLTEGACANNAKYIENNDLINALTLGIVEFDIDGNVLYGNESLHWKLGYEDGSLIGGNIKQVIKGDEDYKALMAFIREQEKICYYNKPVYSKISGSDDKQIDVELFISSIVNCDGEDKRYIAIVNDITERKMRESEEAQDQKLKSMGSLAAGIAHEINTPTQFISDNTEFLKDAFDDIMQLFMKYQELINALLEGKKTDKLVDSIKEMAEDIELDYLREDIPKSIQQSLDGLMRVRDIVYAMRHYAHPEMKEKKATDINKVIENTVTVARNEWKYSSDVKLDLDPELPHIICYSGEISQVILNMLINSVDSIKERIGNGENRKGTIEISTEGKDNSIVIRVSDNGMGIPEDIIGRIYDPFFTTKGVGKGTGQGLSIVWAVVVEKHNGTISVESKEGEGVRFRIELPIFSSMDHSLVENGTAMFSDR